MAAINFPNSPVNGTTYMVGNVTYTYNSYKGVWNITSNGIQGAQGIGGQGIQGISGQYVGQGAQGTQGVQGQQGTQGPQGPQGLSGQYAGKGDQGVQGVQGAGSQGNQGTQGLSGQYAGKGDQGVQGFAGTAALQGAMGAQGTSWGIRVSTTTTALNLNWDSSLYDMYVITAQASALVILADAAVSPMHGQRNLFRIKAAQDQPIYFTTTGSNSFRAIGTTLPNYLTTGNVLYIGCVYNATELRWDIIATREGVA